MIFYFVRHGESVANVEKVISNRGFQHPLTEKGQQQVQTLAETLETVNITHIYTSPLQRAVQTAEILGRAKGVEHTVTDALKEFDCGVMEGRRDPECWDLLADLWRDWLENAHYDARFEGGESFNDILARFVPFINRLIDTHTDADVILQVAHGGTFVVGLPAVLINVDHQFVMQQSLGNACYVKAENTDRGLICHEWNGVRVSE